MPKVGNYVQRDYHNRFSSQRKSTWSDYNKAWSKRREASAQKMQQLRNVASVFNSIGVQASQANTVFVMQNQGRVGAYANQTAAMNRVNVLI
ncbi:flagellar biosynthesis protein [Roseibium sediminicola]|uniref:Flagellar biosynthesis protein n=1 Tax=Roseibium sediminicola TaxID=2933272 RepID=A0ABT0H3U4_9HYPH|nr:flagellar biosynthesis protein [Roseibium sp. CAU 1639]MCK7615763.1 flagellar biosynthesis protein [Roseibium sp. CAU 1639]